MESSKVIVITGSSSGFGRLAATTLADAGHTVYATMRDPHGKNREARDQLADQARRDGGALHVVDMDVGDDRSVSGAIAAIAAEAGRIDVLVNNAGTLYSGITEAYTADEVKAQFETNVFGPVRTSRAVLPHMRARRSGLLVHVSSVIGRVVFPFHGVYSASKYALEALAESYRYELSSFGIDSVIVEPGPFPTNILAGSASPQDHERVAAYGEVAKVPEAMKESFRQLFTSATPPRNELVVEAIVELIDHPGRRPLRTVVMPEGMDFGIDRLNEVVGDIQRTLMKSFQLDGML